MKIKSKLAFMGLLLMSAFGIAQTQISGIVTADDESPIPGVNVIVQGTDNGTTTDFDGNFTISASSGEVLSISYVGFATQNITLTDQTTLEVMLQPGSDELDEVIIIGYGSQRKSDVTGAVASVKSEDLN
ncbi:MAG: carboxypeptidase-like regulatory domain-containing protein, partial [Flavobacteriaceae bacterium]|nr:carboxypeptidase-like regulatory domain-containing protein [Flavobacteriaceae bacterium]